MRLIYSPSAADDLNSIFDFIADDNPRVAEETILRIEQTLLLLQQFPSMGPIGDILNVREFAVPSLPYGIVYRVEEDAVRILNVIHEARQWP